MSEMPKRIWAWGSKRNGFGGDFSQFFDCMQPDHTEYVRADIAEAKIAELQQALNEACSLLEIDTFRGTERVIGGADIRASAVPAFAEYRRKWSEATFDQIAVHGDVARERFELHEQVQVAQHLYSEAQGRISELVEMCTQRDRTIEQLQEMHDSLSNQIGGQDTDIVKLRAEIEQLRQDRDMLESMVKEFSGTVSDMTDVHMSNGDLMYGRFDTDEEVFKRARGAFGVAGSTLMKRITDYFGSRHDRPR